YICPLFFYSTPHIDIHTLSLHDALPICLAASHCADEIVTSISATARTLLQRINEIRVGVACEIERGQWIDLVPRDDGHEEGRSVDRKSTRLNSSHVAISYAVFCLKKKRK